MTRVHVTLSAAAVIAATIAGPAAHAQLPPPAPPVLYSQAPIPGSYTPVGPPIHSSAVHSRWYLPGYGGYGGYGYGGYGYDPYAGSAFEMPVVVPPLVGAGGGPAQATLRPLNDTAQLTIDFPAAATIKVNGSAVAGERATWVLNSTPRTTGELVKFAVRAEWTEDGRRVEWERSVEVSAGDRSHSTISFGTPVKTEKTEKKAEKTEKTDKIEKTEP
ncbi:hypothetical protein [Fimbriiglobus ruber]|uniref:Uncharacterized protein n=1 Tax=Fimbriiglobus ruber TaxID=1908690 RepID=A0A225E9V8_9BACT|nr:hypothetical protein [Fimbriiglobus ruber]OWK45355.1 hypothetical protein FRUB_01686 [Fimbriiglobus ruber]